MPVMTKVPHAQNRPLLDVDECWELLERVAESTLIRRAPRLRELLFYVGRRSLRGGCEQIHEQEIGHEVFGRLESYDTSADNIVRTSVSDLRKRIAAYFESEGADETLRMEIPRGGYVPVFTTATPKSAKLVSDTPQAIESSRNTPSQRWAVAALSAAVCSAMLLGATFLLVYWSSNRAMQRTQHPWKYEPSVSALWSNFLDGSRDTDIVMADTSFLLVQTLGKRPYSLREYMSRSYVSQAAQDQSADPHIRSVLGEVASKNLGSSSEFRLVSRFEALDPLNKRVHLYNAREYMPSLTRQDNLILIGSRISNPWDELFEARLNFVATSDKSGFTTLVNRAPLKGEQAVYVPTDSVGYCAVSYLPIPGGSGKVLLIEGTSSEAVEAAGEFLLSEDQLSRFEKMQKGAEIEAFEVLLQTSQVRSTPLSIETLAYRFYGDTHR